MPLLTTLSVVAAGVLVRLSRGLPFSNAEQLQLDEARKLAKAVKESVKSLRSLLVVVFVTMFTLFLSVPLSTYLATVLSKRSDFVSYIDPAISAFISLSLTYVFVRIFAVISGDIGIVNLQTDYLVKAVERKQGEQFEQSRKSSNAPKMKNPEGYGKIIQ